MQFTGQEIGIIFVSLSSDESGNQIQYPLSEQSLALSVHSKIKDKVDEKKENFIDSEIKFTTEEKAFILKKLDRGFPLLLCQYAVKLREKLNK